MERERRRALRAAVYRGDGIAVLALLTAEDVRDVPQMAGDGAAARARAGTCRRPGRSLKIAVPR